MTDYKTYIKRILVDDSPLSPTMKYRSIMIIVDEEIKKAEYRGLEKWRDILQEFIEWLEEENYFFALTAYSDRLLAHITEHPDFIVPSIRRAEVVGLLKQE